MGLAAAATVVPEPEGWLQVGSKDGDDDESEASATDGDGSDRVACSHPIIIPTEVVQKPSTSARF